MLPQQEQQEKEQYV